MQSIFVDTPGLRIHSLVAGEGARGLPVVLLHGFAATSHAWRHQIPALAAAGHPVFAMDTRGFGRTDKPRTRISRALLGRDIVQFCDATGIERAALVGHDWGGVIAFKAAIDHPERFPLLAILDAPTTVMAPLFLHPYWFKAEPLPEAFLAARARDFIEVRYGGADATILGGRPGNPYPYPPGTRRRPSWIDDETLAHYVEAFSDPDTHFAAIQYYRYAMPFHRVIPDPGVPGGERYQSLSEAQVASMWLHPDGFEAHPWHDEFLDFAPEDRHKRFSGSSLLLYSERLGQVFPEHGDGMLPRGNDFADQFARNLPDVRVREAPCGHHIPEEMPELVSEILLDFAGEPAGA